MEASEGNTGYVERRSKISKGEFDLESPIHSDIFNLNQLLLSEVPLTMKFYKAKPEFALMAPAGDDNKYIIKITDAQLVMRRVRVAATVATAHEASLLKVPARYFLDRVEVKNYTIPKDLMTYSVTNLFLGKFFPLSLSLTHPLSLPCQSII